MNILVTCCLGPHMPAEIKCLTENPDGEEVNVIGVDSNAADKVDVKLLPLKAFKQVPPITDSKYVDELYEICELYDIDILIPNHSDEIEMLTSNEDKFELNGTSVMLTRGKIDIANDKIRWLMLLHWNGVSVPESVPVKSRVEVDEIVKSHPGKKFCVKQSRGCGARGFYLIGDQRYQPGKKSMFEYIGGDALDHMFKHEGEYILQEFTEGIEYSCDVLMDDGKVACCVVKKCLKMQEGIIIEGVVVDDTEISEECIKAAQALEIDGLIGFDLIKDKAGLVRIIDINPRRTATISLDAKAGCNVLWYAAQKAAGAILPEDIPKAKAGTKIVRKRVDFFVPA